MRDLKKPKEQLVNELGELRKKIAKTQKIKLAWKRAEEDLQLFKNLIDQSNDAIFVTDPETGRFMDVNGKACDNLGYSREELLDMGVIDIEAVLPDDFSWHEHVQEVKKKRYVILEGEHKRKDGTVFPVEVNVKHITQQKKDYMVAVVRDLTERKKTEKALRDTTERLQILIQAIPDIVYFKDAQGRNLVVNKVFEDFAGLTQPEIVGKTDKQLFPQDLAEYCKKSDEKVMRSRKPLRLEEEATGKDGKKIFFDTIKSPLFNNRGDIIGLVGVSRDITDQKKMEAALIKERDYLEKMHNAMGDAVVAVKMPERIIVFANNSIESVLGYKPYECIGRPTEIFYAGRKGFLEFGMKLKSAVEEGKEIFRSEQTLMRKDGGIFPAGITTTFFRTNGAVTDVISIVRDISELKLTEKRLNIELQEALKNIKILSGMLPICAACKRIRDDKGYWNQIEAYIRDHSEAEFTHGICPECAKRFYPKIFKDGE